MASRPWLERMAEELHRQQLPMRYRQRLMEELRDHLIDLGREEQRMTVPNMEVVEQRMGVPEQVADIARVEYGRRGFLRRHPLVTFLLGPVLAAVLLGILYGASFVGFAALFLEDRTPGVAPAQSVLWAIQAVVHGIGFVPFALTAILFCWLGRRLDVRAIWPLLACLVIGVFAAQVRTTLELPPTWEQGQMSCGIGIHPMPTQWGLIQLAVPLVIGAFFAGWRGMQRTAA